MHSTHANLSTKVAIRSPSWLRCLSLAVALIAAVWAGANSIAGAAPSHMAHYSVPATDISDPNSGRPIGLLAQAGSTGGSVGQTDKSISGEPAVPAPPPAAKPRICCQRPSRVIRRRRPSRVRRRLPPGPRVNRRKQRLATAAAASSAPGRVGLRYVWSERYKI